MTLRFTVLASGSAGNASLLDVSGFGVLIDAGLGLRTLTSRLEAAGASWEQIRVVLLTHTHTDHWKDSTLGHLARRRIALYCHVGHHAALHSYSGVFASLHAQDLVHGYEAGQELRLTDGLNCLPFPLKHDSGATFGFRFEGPAGSLAYVADLGCWGADLLDHLIDVDVLALEFNHDVAMEKASGRSPALIARVLGDRGHLSNVQAAALLREVRQRSVPGRLRHVVQLHLSRQCNRPALAVAAARAVLDEAANPIALHTARQDRHGPCLVVGPGTDSSLPMPRRNGRNVRAVPAEQSWLPGWGEVEG